MDYNKNGTSLKKTLRNKTKQNPPKAIDKQGVKNLDFWIWPSNLSSISADFYTTTRNNISCNNFPSLPVCACLGGGLEEPSYKYSTVWLNY